MTYDEKLNKFTEGKRFHPASDGKVGQLYLSQQTGAKTHDCAACGAKRAYFLEGWEDQNGNLYWVGAICAKYLMERERELRQAEDRDPDLEREAKALAQESFGGNKHDDRDPELEREATTLALARLGVLRPQELR